MDACPPPHQRKRQYFAIAPGIQFFQVKKHHRVIRRLQFEDQGVKARQRMGGVSVFLGIVGSRRALQFLKACQFWLAAP